MHTADTVCTVDQEVEVLKASNQMDCDTHIRTVLHTAHNCTDTPHGRHGQHGLKGHHGGAYRQHVPVDESAIMVEWETSSKSRRHTG